ncbi:MAG: phage replisome organizer N-terminal domain-containing protein [Deltaproteobacteria bacterium]|jgi:predicted phage replisome organizer|nr:phage replisome organizer N-terminal domain-containing protein [Deltaproteobacteria bacterium]
MSEIKWIKIKTDIFDDEKIKLIDAMPDRDAILVIWFKLLAQAGKCNANGTVVFSGKVPYSDEMLSAVFNRPLNTVRLALKTFQEFAMIEISEDKIIRINNWNKHQNIEGMEKVKELHRLSQEKYRNKQKLLACDFDELESNIYQSYLDGNSLREIGNKFNISKDTANRIIKKIKSAACEISNSVSRDGSNLNVCNDEARDVTDKNQTVSLVSHDCLASVSQVSQKCLATVSQVSQCETETVSKTVSNLVSRDGSNPEYIKDYGSDYHGDVSVMSRDALDIDKDKDKDIEKENIKKEEEDKRSSENRSCAKPISPIISFDFKTNSFCDIPDSVMLLLRTAYPEIDTNSELKEISLWLAAHPDRVSEINNDDGNFIRFIVKWFRNEIDKSKTGLQKDKSRPAKPASKKYAVTFNPESAILEGLSDNDINILRSKFPALDIDAEIRLMESWLFSNPTRRPKNIMRFINIWLTKNQDKAAMKSLNNFAYKTKDEIRMERNKEVSDRMEQKILAGLL